MNGQTGRQKRQIGSQMERQADRQTDRQTDRQADRQTKVHPYSNILQVCNILHGLSECALQARRFKWKRYMGYV